MEERALYRAILAAPHDDTARVVYADWLDENADRFPDVLARSERARAEFIRVQCALARVGPGGWNAGAPDVPLELRQKRLNFRCGRKWRSAFPVSLRTAPFDRGFLRPRCAMRPQEFLNGPSFATAPPYLALPPDSPVRRYVPDGDPFAVCPLWDVHLYASDFHNDPLADRGQYGELLAEAGRSPALVRVGWLKVSFFHTQVYEFLSTGNFANVETLVLNAGPFPDVLEAVAENESFGSLRYVWLGGDRWAWGNTARAAYRSAALIPKLAEANARHLPHGEMRGVLRALLHDVGSPIQVAGAPAAPPRPSFGPAKLREVMLTPEGELTSRSSWVIALVCLSLTIALTLLAIAPSLKERVSAPAHNYRYDPDQFKVPPAVREFEKREAPTTEK